MQNTILLWAMPGAGEMFLIGAALLLFFGGKKIPELMKGLGQGITEFKKGVKGENEQKKIE